jgi:UrcA family protein
MEPTMKIIAALAAFATLISAGMASAQDISVAYGDLKTPAALQARVDQAADKTCKDATRSDGVQRLRNAYDCRAAFRQEVRTAIAKAQGS